MMQSSAPSRQHRFRYDCSEQCRHGKRPLWSMPSSRRLLCKADILYVDEAPTPPLAQHEVGERDLAHASSQTTYFCNSSTGKKRPRPERRSQRRGSKVALELLGFGSFLAPNQRCGTRPQLFYALPI